MTDEMPHLALVPPPLPMPTHFDRLESVLEGALEGGFFTMDDVKRALFENRAQFWPGKNAAIVTEIQTYPNDKAIQVWLAGGDMAEILAMAPGIESWARLQGCTTVLIEGRQGWAKVLREQGYAPFSYTARKVL